MFYDFPCDLSLAEVRAAIAEHNKELGTDIFIEADRSDHVIFNYLFSIPNLFPQPDTGDPVIDRRRAVIRECRGLVMCKTSGKPLARRFQKFFNVNEKEFTQSHLIDWSQPHVILEKLDGSMITPILSGGEIRWGTKMGLTEVAQPVEEFVANHPEYEELAKWAIANSLTPLFEWCSRKQKIVIDYPEDQLILTAIRINRTGEYYAYDWLSVTGETFGVPVVRALPGSVENIQQFMKEAYDIEGAEGYIIRFDNGHMLKVKGAWYCQIHGTKDLLQYEKDVWQLILEDRMDDAMSFMDAVDRDRVERYMKDFDFEIQMTANCLSAVVEIAYNEVQGDKKRFAIEIIPNVPQHERALMFAIWDGKDPVEVVRSYLKKHTSTQNKINIARPMVNGLRWDDYRDRNLVLDD